MFCAVHAQQNYDFGTLSRMGPGFFPTVLGWLLAFCGVLVTVPAWRRSGSPIKVAWRSLFLVLGSVVVFALTLRALGLVVSTFLAAFIATLADEEITWPGRVAVGVWASRPSRWPSSLGD